MSLVTPEFRVSFPSVFKPATNRLSNKEEYSIVALFPKGADLSKLKEAAKKAATDKWGPDQKKWPKNLRMPFRDQAEKAKDVDGRQVLPPGHVEGAIFMNFKSQQKPGVVDQNVQPILDQSEFYPGCWAKASVRVYAYDQMGNAGISFGLGNVQKVKDGEPFGSRSNAEDEFAPVQVSGDNKTGSSSDDLFS